MSRIKVSEYQQFIKDAARIGLDDLAYNVIGLCGECGEVAEWHKKAILRGNKKFTPEMLLSECGDVLHYLTRVLMSQGYDLKDAMEENVDKINIRIANGVNAQ